jgi:hypothetical protein
VERNRRRHWSWTGYLQTSLLKVKFYNLCLTFKIKNYFMESCSIIVKSHQKTSRTRESRHALFIVFFSTFHQSNNFFTSKVIQSKKISKTTLMRRLLCKQRFCNQYFSALLFYFNQNWLLFIKLFLIYNNLWRIIKMTLVQTRKKSDISANPHKNLC